MSRANEKRSLPVTLTDKEFKVRATEYAAAAKRAIKKQEEIKEVTKSMKVDLAELETDRDRLMNIVDTKRENRQVECSWSPDYDRQMWVLFRDDTQEEVATEPMSDKDLQMRLGFGKSYVDPKTGEVKKREN
jgi:ATP-dependent Lon protease